LQIAAARLNRSSSWWGTSSQWQAVGNWVKPGEEGIRLPNDDVVFNLDQTDGIYQPPTLTHPSPESFFDTLVSRAGIKLEWQTDATCDCNRGKDLIRIPCPWMFIEVDCFFHALSHEIFHFSERYTGWKSGNVADDELRADLGAAYLGAAISLKPLDMRFRQNHEKYVTSWIAHMHMDPELLFRVCNSVTATIPWLLKFVGMEVHWQLDQRSGQSTSPDVLDLEKAEVEKKDREAEHARGSSGGEQVSPTAEPPVLEGVRTVYDMSHSDPSSQTNHNEAVIDSGINGGATLTSNCDHLSPQTYERLIRASDTLFDNLATMFLGLDRGRNNNNRLTVPAQLEAEKETLKAESNDFQSFIHLFFAKGEGQAFKLAKLSQLYSNRVHDLANTLTDEEWLRAFDTIFANYKSSCAIILDLSYDERACVFEGVSVFDLNKLIEWHGARFHESARTIIVPARAEVHKTEFDAGQENSGSGVEQATPTVESPAFPRVHEVVPAEPSIESGTPPNDHGSLATVVEPSVTLPPDQVADLRQQLTAYAASLLGAEAEQFKEFGDTVSIAKVTSCYVYRMSLDFVWEMRELVRRVKPFDGSPPETPAVTENGLDVWAYYIPSESTGEFPVPGSDTAISCYKCRGSGQVSCCECDGRGYIPCPTCKATKRLRCAACSGRGYTEKEELGGYRPEPCRCNGGIAWFIGGTCNECNGVGWISVKWFRTMRYSCTTCHGSGAITCQACNTNGALGCGQCHRRGVVCCSGCNGERYASISYLAITKSLSSAKTMGYDTNSNLSDDTLEGLLASLEHDDYLNVSEQQLPPSFSAASYCMRFSVSVTAWVQNKIADAHHLLDKLAAAHHILDKPRIVKQCLWVGYLTGTVCEYTHHGKDYRFTSFGKRQVAVAADSPITEYLTYKSESNRLRGQLKGSFEVWAKHIFGGVHGIVLVLAGLYLLIWTPIAGIFHCVFQPPEGTVMNSITGPWWPGIGISTGGIVLIGLRYGLFADKAALRKKKEMVNESVMEKIRALEGEMAIIRRGSEVNENEPNGNALDMSASTV
jgi:hypothetical protein